jgi:hypothetical protein
MQLGWFSFSTRGAALRSRQIIGWLNFSTRGAALRSRPIIGWLNCGEETNTYFIVFGLNL